MFHTCKRFVTFEEARLNVRKLLCWISCSILAFRPLIVYKLFLYILAYWWFAIKKLSWLSRGNWKTLFFGSLGITLSNNIVVVEVCLLIRFSDFNEKYCCEITFRAWKYCSSSWDATHAFTEFAINCKCCSSVIQLLIALYCHLLKINSFIIYYGFFTIF